MSRSARTNAATTFLLGHVELGATGRVSSGTGAASVDVYLMNGQVMAATAPDDLRQLIRLCHMRGGLTSDQAGALDSAAGEGGGVFGELLDAVPPELLDQLLFDRYRQNLATYLGGAGKPRFEALRTVFVDNLQMGHDVDSIVEDCCRLWDEANSLDLDAELVRGSGRLDNKEQRLVAARLGSEPQTISSLLVQLPLEPLVARVVILDMLRSGAASVPDGMGLEEDDEDVDDDPTVYVREDDATESIPRPPLPSPEPPFTDGPSGGAEASPGQPADSQAAEGAGNLTSLSAWLDAAANVDEDELDFFSDHDHERGGGEEGAFSTETHNLDKVEVASMPEEVLEADEAPTARFSAPVLSEDEAMGKLDVANQVLTLVVQAFDDAEGAGRGRAVVQLLVDGSPSRFAALLQDIQVDDSGRLPDSEILENLYGRPSTEHRQLINQTLVDIIERALSSAADELPDEAFDHVLESVAGYRQRLGL